MSKNYFGITDTGKVRGNNEDTFIAKVATTDNLIIASVIDGVGGYSGGEIAAEIAKMSVLEHLGKPSVDLLADMKKAIADANTKIISEKEQVKELENMACVLTLAVADLNKNIFYYAHVGDTRLYLLRDRSLVKITKDQSFVGFMEDSGRITEDEAMKHPKRNEINKALGFGNDIVAQEDYIETGQSPFLPGDLLLLCSDGLSDMVNKQQITEILLEDDELNNKGSNLIAAANANGGLDNITVVLVENTNKPAKHVATKPGQTTRVTPSQPLLFDENKPVKPPIVLTVEEPEKSNKFPTTIQAEPPKKPASRTGLIILLSVLALTFLGTTIFLYWLYNNHPANDIKPQPLTEVTEKRNTKEIMLQDTLNKLKGQTLVITDSLFSSPIVLHQALEFNRDTLYIKADKEFLIICDTLYKGAAINIRPATRFVQLRNISFENFETAIISSGNALVLKNIRFTNCPNTIQSTYNLAQKKYINGSIPRSSFTADSLIMKTTE
ncbi:MAG: protein phosphatase 2C domain-containing protein [Bacteroidota bacterium]